MHYEARHNLDQCTKCDACAKFVSCPGSNEEICIGCGACTLICPNEALEFVEAKREKDVQIEVDGKLRSVPERITVKEALRAAGCKIADCLPEKGVHFAPCGVGACWNCAVQIDGDIRRACVTEAKEGMKIITDLPEHWVPLRIVGPAGGHSMGGVGTPWEVRKGIPRSKDLEICCLVAGCNFRCPQCHNWMITNMSNGQAYTPPVAAEMLTRMKNELKLNRFCLSGGEITLNRPWLVQLLKELRQRNPEPAARLHISTNGSMLTEDYIDELVDAGLNDFGIDLKGLHIETFMRITGLKNRKMAQKCKENAWNAVGYITSKYRGEVFLGVGVPYNEELISMEEIRRIGKEICSIDPAIQTTAMTYWDGDYRSKIMWPSLEEMKVVRRLLEKEGLTTVQCFATEFIPPSENEVESSHRYH